MNFRSYCGVTEGSYMLSTEELLPLSVTINLPLYLCFALHKRSKSTSSVYCYF